jgi:hypothetical protein
MLLRVTALSATKFPANDEETTNDGETAIQEWCQKPECESHRQYHRAVNNLTKLQTRVGMEERQLG